MPSIAWPARRPIPMPAPITARPAPMPAPSMLHAPEYGALNVPGWDTACDAACNSGRIETIFLPLSTNVICHARDLSIAIRQRDLPQNRPNGILQPARPDTYTELSILRVSAHPRESVQ